MRISIIVPVLNERGINGFIATLTKSIAPRVMDAIEIIVVDGDPHGSTLQRISTPLISNPSIKRIIAPKGRARQQNRGAEMATGTVLLFLHADTRLPRHFDELIRKTVVSGYSGGAFDLEIDTHHPLLKGISRIASFRSRITGIPYGDQAIFVTRSLFERIGRFPDIPLMEDIALMQRIKRSGKAFTILPEKALTSPRMWYKKGIIYTMIRNPLLASLYYLGVSPKVLVKFYYGIGLK